MKGSILHRLGDQGQREGCTPTQMISQTKKLTKKRLIWLGVQYFLFLWGQEPEQEGTNCCFSLCTFTVHFDQIRAQS